MRLTTGYDAETTSSSSLAFRGFRFSGTTGMPRSSFNATRSQTLSGLLLGRRSHGSDVMRGWKSRRETKKTRRNDPVASQLLQLAGPGAESALLPGLNRLSGRSQRGDSAWCKTLDHLLSLLMKHQYRH